MAPVIQWRELLETSGAAGGIAAVDSDGQGVLFTKARQYVWDSNALAWVRQTGTSTGVASQDVTDRAGRLLGVVYGSQGQQLKQTATNFNLQTELATGATLYDARQIRALTSADIVAAVQSGTWTVQPGNTANTTAWKVDGSAVTQPVSGTVTANQGGTWTVQPGNTANTTAWLQSQIASRLDSANLAVSATGVSGAAVTLTLPAVASQFHYIGFIQVVRFAVALLTAGATPVLVTTTNLPGTPTLSFPADAAAAGTEFIETVQSATPIKSSTVNTATTVVCPATTSVIWRVNAWYYAAV